MTPSHRGTVRLMTEPVSWRLVVKTVWANEIIGSYGMSGMSSNVNKE